MIRKGRWRKLINWKILLLSIVLITGLFCGYIFQLHWLKDPSLAIFGILASVIFQKLFSKSEEEKSIEIEHQNIIEELLKHIYQFIDSWNKLKQGIDKPVREYYERLKKFIENHSYELKTIYSEEVYSKIDDINIKLTERLSGPFIRDEILITNKSYRSRLDELSEKCQNYTS